MKIISAAFAAILCVSAVHAHAAGVPPGLYQAFVLYSSVTDPSGLCASKLNIVQGNIYEAQAIVGGAGKPVVMNSAGVPPNGNDVAIATLTFSNFPSTIKTDPTNYSGTAIGSQSDTGVALSWTTGTINTIASDQFKVTLSDVTVSYGGQAVCVISIDAGFLLTGR